MTTKLFSQIFQIEELGLTHYLWKPASAFTFCRGNTSSFLHSQWETRCLPINKKFSSSISQENPKRYWPWYKLPGITKATAKVKDKLHFEQCVQVTIFSLSVVFSSQNFPDIFIVSYIESKCGSQKHHNMMKFHITWENKS